MIHSYNSEFLTFELDGRSIAFHKTSQIEIQVGRGKNAYKTSLSFNAKDFGRAVMYYNSINIGKGYKKRLICKTLNKPLLARTISI
jgi:hypothetical protein